MIGCAKVPTCAMALEADAIEFTPGCSLCPLERQAKPDQASHTERLPWKLLIKQGAAADHVEVTKRGERGQFRRVAVEGSTWAKSRKAWTGKRRCLSRHRSNRERPRNTKRKWPSCRRNRS